MRNPATAFLALILISNGLAILFLLVEALGAKKSKKARASLITMIPIVGTVLACFYSAKGSQDK